MRAEIIAHVLHEANRALCEAQGQFTQVPWAQASEHQRSATFAGIDQVLACPEIDPSALHDAWIAGMVASGWKYSPERDNALKLHPCILPYEQVPESEKAKDRLFKAIVLALRG